MELRKTYNGNISNEVGGFSLIEVMVVLTIMSMLLASTLFVSSDWYQRTAFLSEREVLITLLQTARTQALANVNQKPHGVALYPDSYEGYVLFAGIDFAHADTSVSLFIPASYPIEFDATSPQEVVFTQISGDSNYEGPLVLLDSNRDALTTITINYEGAISK